jgi:adenosine deaminase CECR1
LEYGSNVHFVFHAGESNNDNNTNILDCILLGTKRIGHGCLLFKQPYLIEEVKKRGLIVEVGILSNLSMRYCTDIRQHPSIMMHNAGIQISLSSDDPGAFRLTPVSYDTFAALYAFPLDLKDIKRIQLNGIDGMLLKDEEKLKHSYYFLGRWKEFIKDFLFRNKQ